MLRAMKLRVVTVHLPEPYIEGIDKLVKAKIFHNRAEAIRTAVRDMLFELLPSIEGGS